MDKFDNPLLFVCLTDLAQFQPAEIFFVNLIKFWKKMV